MISLLHTTYVLPYGMIYRCQLFVLGFWTLSIPEYMRVHDISTRSCGPYYPLVPFADLHYIFRSVR